MDRYCDSDGLCLYNTIAPNAHLLNNLNFNPEAKKSLREATLKTMQGLEFAMELCSIIAYNNYPDISSNWLA